METLARTGSSDKESCTNESSYNAPGNVVGRLAALMGRLEAVKASWTNRSAMWGPLGPFLVPFQAFWGFSGTWDLP
eukprot:2690546-Pyramimonas_sp.AAC.1